MPPTILFKTVPTHTNSRPCIPSLPRFTSKQVQRDTYSFYPQPVLRRCMYMTKRYRGFYPQTEKSIN